MLGNLQPKAVLVDCDCKCNNILYLRSGLKGTWKVIVGKFMLFHPAVHLHLNTATDPFSEALNSHSAANLQSFKTSKEKESEKLTYLNESIYHLTMEKLSKSKISIKLKKIVIKVKSPCLRETEINIQCHSCQTLP